MRVYIQAIVFPEDQEVDEDADGEWPGHDQRTTAVLMQSAMFFSLHMTFQVLPLIC
eukprot:SAG22_NODE_1820_length_3514_cov_2.304539_4_plen_56_part_00